MNRATGFTLVEMVVALALFALVAAAGLRLVDGVLGVGERTAARLDRVGELDRAFTRLGQDLDAIDGGAVEVAPGTLAFSRRGDAGLPVRIRYGTVGGALIRELDGRRQRLAGGVAAVEWAAFEARAGWQPGWPVDPRSRDRPGAIALTLRLDAPATSLRRVFTLPARPRDPLLP